MNRVPIPPLPTLAKIALLVVVFILLGEYYRRDTQQGTRSGTRCRAMGSNVLKHIGRNNLIINDDTSDRIYSDEGFTSPLACGVQKEVDVNTAQLSILDIIPQIMVYMDSVGILSWVDRDNLAAVTSSQGGFFKSDYTFDVGVLSSDFMLLQQSFKRQSTLLSVTDTDAVGASKNSSHVYPLWDDTSNSTIVVLGSENICVFHKSTGAAIFIRPYAPAEYPTLREVPFLESCTVYGVGYQCPKQSRQYLNQIAGGSWVYRVGKSSAGRWVVVSAVFATIMYWVLRT